jgi:nicotinamidase-related amidase
MDQTLLKLNLRCQELISDERGYAAWQVQSSLHTVPAAKTVILICDMWDNHWSRGAADRVSAMAPRMNQVLHTARERGVQIIHAPSETMAFYADRPARRRMGDLPPIALPELADHPDPPVPVDDSDGGSDTGETSWFKAWTRQHRAIEIDEERDGVSDDGAEVYRFIRHRNIEQVLIMGVHTNMCVLRRPFAIKAMVRRGIPVALVRDLTDALYNPAKSPYVSHAEGTRLVVEYIEKFWCPSITSADLTGAGPNTGNSRRGGWIGRSTFRSSPNPGRCRCRSWPGTSTP